MNQLFYSISVTYKLFRQPNLIGDVIEVDNELYLIVGIENFVCSVGAIKINYTCQLLKEHDYSSSTISAHSELVMLEQSFQFEDPRIHLFQLGSTQMVMEGDSKSFYKLVEFTEISLEGTAIKISVLAHELVPAAPDVLKNLYTTERKKRLQLRIV